MYKITFKLSSPISFIDKPLFDGIIAYLFFKDKYGIIEHSVKHEYNPLYDVDLFPDFPLKKDSNDLYVSSFMQFDNSLNYTSSWKKRWANQHDYIADFGKSKRQVEIDKGAFKSYDTPLNLYSIPEVYFYFDTDNLEFLTKLVSNLWGLGKKTSQGYGEIESFDIEKLDYNPFEKQVLRPIPILLSGLDPNEQSKALVDGRCAMHRVKPPYWSVQDMKMCLVS